MLPRRIGMRSRPGYDPVMRERLLAEDGPTGGATGDIALPAEVQALFDDRDFDIEFPYLVHVQEMHDLIVIFDLQNTAHPRIRDFLKRYPVRPSLPPELNAMIAAYRKASMGVCAA